jgi:hypothetical protein
MTFEKLPLDPATHTPLAPPAVIRRSSTAFDGLQISPDGGTLATFTVGRNEDLCLVSVDGQKLRRLTDDGFRNRGPVFAPGGRLIFYSDRGGDYALYSIAADGSGVLPLAPATFPFFLLPALSPDGRFLAAGRYGGRVAVFPLVAGAEGSLSVGARALFEFESRWPWSWSSDGTRLLALGLGLAEGFRAVAEAILCTPANKTCEGLGVRANCALFTPDGRSAIVTATDGIRVLDLASRASRLILPAPDWTLMRIALSSDGRSLYFLRNVTEGDIWVGTFK